MIEVFSGLYVGTQLDFEKIDGRLGWVVVQACKEPFHRRAVGYVGNIDPSHSEYLVARRGDRLILNMICPAGAEAGEHSTA